jgi:hypothetical protein
MISWAIFSGICMGDAKVATPLGQVNTAIRQRPQRPIYRILTQLVTEIGSGPYYFWQVAENLNQIVR